MPAVAVTGASGFIGSALCRLLRSKGHEVRPIGRQLLDSSQGEDSEDTLELAMAGATVVMHLAARAHVTKEEHADPLAEYRRVNLSGTLRVAAAASRAGVRRMVFVSSIGVLGNSSGERTFLETDEPAPTEHYAISKWEAEQELRAFAQASPLEIAIVRPPLVYGPRVKGNFLRLLRMLRAGVPLPLGSIRNQRSYVAVENLCDVLALCAFHPAAAGRMFLVADGEDVSTPDLLSMLAHGMQRRARLFRCPMTLLRMAATIVGKQAELQRLSSNLRVDSAAVRGALGWQPRVKLHAGLVEMAQWFAGQDPR
jgi:nucleoside-diphosphate-sugar epimerase